MVKITSHNNHTEETAFNFFYEAARLVTIEAPKLSEGIIS